MAGPGRPNKRLAEFMDLAAAALRKKGHTAEFAEQAAEASVLAIASVWGGDLVFIPTVKNYESAKSRQTKAA